MTAIVSMVISAPVATAASINVIQITHNDVIDIGPSIAVNPLNSKNLVAAWTSCDQVLCSPAGDLEHGFGCRYGASFDGGKSWVKIAPIPGVPELSLEPHVAFDKDGTAYFACFYVRDHLAHDLIQSSAIYVSKSTDGGLTWGTPAVAFGPGLGPDFEKISTNPTSGDVYVVAAFVKGNAADGGIQVFFTRSTDHGASFSSPVQISAHDEGAWAWDAYATAGVDPGTVYVTYGVGASTNHQFSGYDRIFIAKSTDGGMTFSPGQRLLAVAPLPVVLPNFPQTMDANMWSAVDRSSGEIYVNFVDYRNGDADVWLLRLHDTGSTFVVDGVTRVNDDPVANGADQFFPYLSLAPSGRIDICFQDRRYAPGNTLLFTTCAYSSDGGQSFTNIQVTTEGFDGTNNEIGRYQGQASTDRMVIPIFMGDGYPGAGVFGQEVFVARVPL